MGRIRRRCGHPSRLAEEARTSRVNARAFIPGMTISHPLISKTREFNFENVAGIALRHSEIFTGSRNPFMAV
jgi:hypothetical protein